MEAKEGLLLLFWLVVKWHETITSYYYDTEPAFRIPPHSKLPNDKNHSFQISIFPYFWNRTVMHMPLRSKRRIGNLFGRRQRRQRKNRSDFEGSSLLSEMSTFDQREVRSIPTKRHLSSDGSSGPSLQAILEKVAASSAEPSIFIKRIRNYGCGKDKLTASKRKKDCDEKETATFTIPVDRNSNEEEPLVAASRRSIDTDDSSGRHLQNILETLVDKEDIQTTKGFVTLQRTNRNEESKCEQPSKMEAILEIPTKEKCLADNSFCANFLLKGESLQLSPRRARYEIDDPNQHSKIYLQQRKKQGKNSRKSNAEMIFSRDLLKNCGIIPELELSSGSTISMSSCSLDSVLDDPERLDKYKLLNQPPPPPPRRNRKQNAFVERKWTDDIKSTVIQAYGKASRLLGCVSPQFS